MGRSVRGYIGANRGLRNVYTPRRLRSGRVTARNAVSPQHLAVQRSVVEAECAVYPGSNISSIPFGVIRPNNRHSYLDKIAVSDRATLRGLTQFALSSRGARRQMLEHEDISNCIFVKEVLRYAVLDRPQLVDSKAERCRSGRSSTLGKRCVGTAWRRTESHFLQSFQRLPSWEVFLRVSR